MGSSEEILFIERCKKLSQTHFRTSYWKIWHSWQNLLERQEILHLIYISDNNLFIYHTFFIFFQTLSEKVITVKIYRNSKETSVLESICYLKCRFCALPNWGSVAHFWFHFLKNLFVRNTSVPFDSCFQIFQINEQNREKSTKFETLLGPLTDIVNKANH